MTKEELSRLVSPDRAVLSAPLISIRCTMAPETSRQLTDG